MASPGGAYSSGTSSLQNSGSGSEGDIQQQQVHVMDQKKRKRMQSNRESARRSRMKKQQHMEDLNNQIEYLKKENNQISRNVGVTTQMYLNVEGENAILRVQMAELSNRLQSLNDIINYIESSNSLFQETDQLFNDCGFFDTWNSFPVNQPIMASADMLMY
ncbi:bZIP transcription factor 44-like [Cicer arietinum]|uniref:BZIP transcription factor 44-like n=1 Tax=Cicer arietinum TaxID=3827 RepID=A0A1S2YG52_CICAR|nr:bZIP transcription factor 44-like [Cicer arietinum]